MPSMVFATDQAARVVAEFSALRVRREAVDVGA